MSLAASGSLIPSKALNAGSTSPLLAVRTALTTAASIVGNASRSVFSFCSRWLRGLEGFLGGSSLGSGAGVASVSAVPVSCPSSSKSRGLAVVGDSGGASVPAFNGLDCGQY